jgi:hypothetical protein
MVHTCCWNLHVLGAPVFDWQFEENLVVGHSGNGRNGKLFLGQDFNTVNFRNSGLEGTEKIFRYFESKNKTFIQDGTKNSVRYFES